MIHDLAHFSLFSETARTVAAVSGERGGGVGWRRNDPVAVHRQTRSGGTDRPPRGPGGARERAVLQIRGVCGRSSDDPCSPRPIGLAFARRVSGPSLSSLHAAWCRRGRSRPPPVLSLCPPAPGWIRPREPAREAGGWGGVFSVAPAVLAALAPRPRPCGASPFEPELRGALR